MEQRITGCLHVLSHSAFHENRVGGTHTEDRVEHQGHIAGRYGHIITDGVGCILSFLTGHMADAAAVITLL